jgi:hypothetical protein
MFGTIFSAALFIVVAGVILWFFWFAVVVVLLSIGGIGFADTQHPLFIGFIVVGLCLASLGK